MVLNRSPVHLQHSYRPTFWPDMTQFQTWPKNPTWPRCLQVEYFYKFSRRSIKNITPIEVTRFSIIWPTDLVWTQHDLDIIKTNILTNYQEDPLKNMTPIEVTRFFYYLTYWPSFWHHMTNIKLDLDIIKMNILTNYQEDPLKNMTSIEVTRFFYYLTYWPSFDPTWPNIELDLDIIKMNILTNYQELWESDTAGVCLDIYTGNRNQLLSLNFVLRLKQTLWNKNTGGVGNFGNNKCQSSHINMQNTNSHGKSTSLVKFTIYILVKV